MIANFDLGASQLHASAILDNAFAQEQLTQSQSDRFRNAQYVSAFSGEMFYK
jgi:hypothetical protein